MANKVILDVDTGTDDAVAIMLAALHPSIDLIGVTTVNGNVPVTYCTDNSLRVLDHIGAAVPVYEGLARPLARLDFPVRLAFRDEPEHETSMHGLTLDLPEATSTKQLTHAVTYLLDTFDQPGAEEIVLIATGPLSNLGAALALDPGLAQKIKRLIIMGGGHNVGNVSASAEFNIWADPEAARMVLLSGISDITLVPLDATHRAVVSDRDCVALRELGTPAATASANFIERRIQGHDATQPLEMPHTAAVHDPLCVAALIDPSVITTKPYYVDVETQGLLTMGRTVLDMKAGSTTEPNCRFAVDGDAKAFVDLLLATFAR